MKKTNGEFKEARSARDAKRRHLQVEPKKQKRSSTALTDEEYLQLIKLWDEETPSGLQKKFFFTSSLDACKCRLI